MERLEKEVERRYEQRRQIRERIEDLLGNVYGISNFNEIAQTYIPFWGVEASKPFSVLFRALPSTTIEDLLCMLVPKALGMKPYAFSFSEAPFNPDSRYDESLVVIRFISWSPDGLKKEVIEGPTRLWKGKSLNGIPIKEKNISLADFHLNLRERIFDNTYPLVDISGFMKDCFKKSRKSPPWSDGKDYYQPEWYFFILLCLFLDGSSVLLESIENIKNISVLQMMLSQIKKETGLLPLIVPIPTRNDGWWHYHCLQLMFENNRFIKKVEQGIRIKKDRNFFNDIFERVGNSIISLARVP